MIYINPFCDICERYCENEWYEVKVKYRLNYRDLNEKRNEKYVVCGKCRKALFDLIKERSLVESEKDK